MRKGLLRTMVPWRVGAYFPTLLLAVGICALPSHGQAEIRSYQVKPGDGLEAIARSHGTTVRKLLELNAIRNPDELEIGQVLRVPAPAPPFDPIAHPNTEFDTPTSSPAASAPPAEGLKEKGADSGSAAASGGSEPPERPKRIHAPTRKPAPRPAASQPSASRVPVAAATPKADSMRAEKPLGGGFLKEYEEPIRQEDRRSNAQILADLALKLLIVLGLAYVSILGLRFLTGRQGMVSRRARSQLRVLETAHLAPNRSVHLVKVADKIMVLASTPEQVVAIGEISDPEAAARVVRESGMPSFGDCFGSALSGTPSAPGEDSEKAPDVASEIRSGIRHLWERAQEIRGVRVGLRRDER